MAGRKSLVSQAELTRIARAMRAGGVSDWNVEVERPDGAKIRIFANKGSEGAAGDDIDAMIDKIPNS